MFWLAGKSKHIGGTLCFEGVFTDRAQVSLPHGESKGLGHPSIWKIPLRFFGFCVLFTDFNFLLILTLKKKLCLFMVLRDQIC